MDSLELNISYSEVTLILDSIRHYIKYIDNIGQDDIGDDELSNLFTDCENLRYIESFISKKYAVKFGKY